MAIALNERGEYCVVDSRSPVALYRKDQGVGKLVQKVIVCPVTQRQSFEYAIEGNLSKMQAWMGQYADRPKLMIQLNNAYRSPAEAAQIVEDWHRRNPNGVR